MAYSSTKPANGASLVSADIRENFRALKEDDIVDGITRSVIAGTGLSGGGQLNADRTINLSDSSVTQSKLKTSQGSVSVTGTQANITLPGGEYGFYPQTKSNYAAAGSSVLASIAGLDDITGSTSYITNIFLGNEGAFASGYAQQRYVTSSGEVFWVFILRDKITKDIISMYQAPDHPCFGNGGKPSVVQHPFGSYDPETQEIIVINPTHAEVESMKKEGERGEDEPDKDLLETIIENYDIDEVSKPAWPSIPVTVGLPKDYETKAMGAEVITIKKVIPRPAGTLCRSLKKLEAENVAEK